MRDRLFTRRTLLRSAGLFAAASALAACGAATPTPAPAKPAEAPKPAAAEPTKPAAAAPAATSAPAAPAAAAKPTEAPKPAAAPAQATGSSAPLHAVYWSASPVDKQVFVDTFALFEKLYPNLKVNYDDTPSDGFDAKILTMIAGGTPPDVFKLHPSWVLRFIQTNQLVELTPIAKADPKADLDDVYPAQIGFWSDKGKLYGMPYYSGPSFVFWNKTIFKQKNLKTPEEHEKAGTWTWDTLRDLAKQATGGAGAEKTFGWDAAQQGGNMQFYLCVPVWDNGGELIKDDETAWTIDSPEVLEVVQWHQDMYLKDKSVPSPADVQGINWLFGTGRLAMSWGHKFRVNELANSKFEVGMIGSPKGKARRLNRDGPNATGIPTIAKRRDDSYTLARYLGGAEAAPAYIGGGATIPVRKSLANSEHFKKGLLPFERIEVHNEAAASVRAWRVPGKAPEINRAFTAQWDRIVNGSASPADAMKAAKAQMDELLK